MAEKKSLQAKIVKHAHRRRFQDYVRTKGRDKSTIAYVYWSMYLRSGKGNIFVLDEELFLGDLGLSHATLHSARKTLQEDGWIAKEKQAFNSKTGRWSPVRWFVREESVVNSVDNSTAVNLADSGSTDSGSTDDTVGLHTLYADASTLSCTPSASTSTDSSERESEPVSPSADADVLLASLEDQNRNRLELVADQKQDQPHTDSMVPPHMVDASRILLENLNPMLSASAVEAQLPTAWRVLQHFEEHYGVEYSLWAAQFVVEWNRAHRSGKYASKDDKKMYLRTAEQYLKALDSPTATLLGDYESHDFEHCPTCLEHKLRHVSKRIEEDKQEEQAAAEAAASKAALRAERERIAKLCGSCKTNLKEGCWIPGSPSEFEVCATCYDKRYEQQQLNPNAYRDRLIEPRPEYLAAKEVKARAEREARQAKQREEQANLRCNGCKPMQTFGSERHRKGCPLYVTQCRHCGGELGEHKNDIDETPCPLLQAREAVLA